MSKAIKELIEKQKKSRFGERYAATHIAKVNKWAEGELEVVEKLFYSLESALEFAKDSDHEVKIYESRHHELVHHERPVFDNNKGYA